MQLEITAEAIERPGGFAVAAAYPVSVEHTALGLLLPSVQVAGEPTATPVC